MVFVFFKPRLNWKKTHKLIRKILQNVFFSCKLHLYRFSFGDSDIILIIIAYISIDLNFKVLADTFSELSFFLILISLVYNHVTLGLKIQHDLQGANFCLHPKALLQLLCLQFAFTHQHPVGRYRRNRSASPATFSTLWSDVDSTCRQQDREKHQGITLHQILPQLRVINSSS